MKKLEIEYLSIDQLKPYQNNAKIHTDEQIEQICESIREFGMNDPIAIWKDGEIIEGHGRLLACRKMGMKEVPVIRLDDLTDEQRRAYMNIHNQLTMNTGFDFDLLNMELAKIDNIDMAKFGFDLSALEPEKEIVEDDYQNAEKAPARVQAGQIWVLGAHRLMCGDSSAKIDADKLFGGG